MGSRRIFDPIFTTRPVGRGMGLGRSTGMGILRSSGGDISVESEPGRGTAFAVTLPRARAAGPAAPTEPRAAAS